MQPYIANKFNKSYLNGIIVIVIRTQLEHISRWCAVVSNWDIFLRGGSFWQIKLNKQWYIVIVVWTICQFKNMCPQMYKTKSKRKGDWTAKRNCTWHNQWFNINLMNWRCWLSWATLINNKMMSNCIEHWHNVRPWFYDYIHFSKLN